MIEIVSYPSDPRSVKLAAILGRRAGVVPEVEAAARDILAQVREALMDRCVRLMVRWSERMWWRDRFSLMAVCHALRLARRSVSAVSMRVAAWAKWRS